MYVDPVYDDGDAVESSSEESSSCPPSPLMYRPYIPEELADDPDLRAALRIAETEYRADRGKA